MEVVLFGSIGSLLTSGGKLRPGTVRTIQEARAAHQRIVLITSVASRAIDWIGACSLAGLSVGDVDLVLERGHGESLSTTYATALSMLGAEATNCIAIVDSPACATAAGKVGTGCIMTPGMPGERARLDAEMPVVSCLGDMTEGARQIAGQAIITHGIVTLRSLVDLRRRQAVSRMAKEQAGLAAMPYRYSGANVALRKTA